VAPIAETERRGNTEEEEGEKSLDVIGGSIEMLE
jgi:hypothetical protein